MKSLIQRVLGRWANRTALPALKNASSLTALVDASGLSSPDTLVRMGTQYGGWIIPFNHALTEDSVCYLAGAGEDISFDCELATRFRCKVRILDPTPRAVEHFDGLRRAVSEGRRFPVNNSETEFYEIAASDLARITFLPVGLAGQDATLKFFLPRNPAHVSCSTVNLQNTTDYFTAQCFRLSTLMAQQHDARVALLKIDIEGAEYSVISDIVRVGLLPPLLLVEFDETHSPRDDEAPRRIREHVELLIAAGMTCVAVEGSNMTFQRTA